MLFVDTGFNPAPAASIDETTPLLDSCCSSQPQVYGDQAALIATPSLCLLPVESCAESKEVNNNAYRLYISHFLSAWNFHVFEFSAPLYLAIIYPGTLFPMSVYALIRALGVAVFTPVSGHYIDTRDRLFVVRLAIVLSRVAAIASFVIFYVLLVGWPLGGESGPTAMLVLLSALACIERVTFVMNMVAVEKDWVVVVAKSDRAMLTKMNSQMRRIDLICKLVSPLFIATIVNVLSPEIAVIINLTMNVVSVGVEYFAIARVYDDMPELQQSKVPKQEPATNIPYSPNPAAALPTYESSLPTPRTTEWYQWPCVACRKTQETICAWTKKSVADFRLYTHHPVFLPSLATAIVWFTVLNFNGQMVTYLMAVGMPPNQIGYARSASVISEVLATFAMPWLVNRIGPAKAALWFSGWQSATLVAGGVLFCVFFSNMFIATTALIAATVLSRLGLLGFYIVAQLVVQEEVEAENRGAFSSMEVICQNLFDMCAFIMTAIFYRPEQFQVPVIVSVVAVVAASFVLVVFVERREHLVFGRNKRQAGPVSL